MSRSREQGNQLPPEERERLCIEAASDRVDGKISSDEYRRILRENDVIWAKAAKAIGVNKLPQPLRSIMRRLI